MTFHKHLEKVAGRYEMRKLFDDFLQCAVCAFSLGRMEDMYQSVMKRYGEDAIRVNTAFAHALADMVNDYSDKLQHGEWVDYIGRYYEKIGASNARTGQFFTPESLCNLMAAMTGIDKEGGSISDPCSGSGRTLIAHAMVSPNQRLITTYYAGDIDGRCVNMTIVNMVMHGMKGFVVHQNALSLKTFAAYRIWLPETGLGVSPMMINE